MAQPLDPKDLVSLEDHDISTMWETSALVELLERKGILTKQEVLAMIQELRRANPRRSGHGDSVGKRARPRWTPLSRRPSLLSLRRAEHRIVVTHHNLLQ